MNPSSSNIITHAARAIPETNNFMFDHIGAIDFSNTNARVAPGDNELDKDISYVREQKALIEKHNDTLYKRDQHNESFDMPQQGFNVVSNIHPLGINMLPSHSDRGFDYRDFPQVLAKSREGYDPYIGYLYEQGLIGKVKSRYNVNYINIDSRDRNRQTTSRTRNIIKLNTDPIKFVGTSMRIKIPLGSGFEHNKISINDKITINNVTEKEITIRSIINDDFGDSIHYFLAEEGRQYMTVRADNNIQINSAFTSELKDRYTDANLKVDFRGFVGDRKTEWYFDTRMFMWEILPIIFLKLNGDIISAKRVLITEDVLGVIRDRSCDEACLDVCHEAPCYEPCDSGPINTLDTEHNGSQMLIADFVVDDYGIVIKINSNIPYRSNIVWINDGIVNMIPDIYYIEATNALLSVGLNIPPNVPTSIYTVMEYFERVQNIIRPIFLQTMIVTAPNFVLNYERANRTYHTTVRMIIPEATKVSTTNMYGNISLNLLNSQHRMYLTTTDIEDQTSVSNSTSTLTSTLTSLPTLNRFYIKLNNPYIKKRFEFSNPLLSGALLIRIFETSVSDVTIRYKHQGGIPLNLINSDYPVGFNNLTGFKYVADVKETTSVTDGQLEKNLHITVELDRVGLYDKSFGGSDVYIGLIDHIYPGFYNPNSYVVDLERIYNNVVMVRMVSSCFPRSQKLIMDGLTGGRRNNRFYWQNIDDGDTMYTIEIDPGNYTYAEFKEEFETKVRKVHRFGKPGFTNHIILDINSRSERVSFINYNRYTPNGSKVYVKKISLSKINKICTSSLRFRSGINTHDCSCQHKSESKCECECECESNNSHTKPITLVFDPDDVYYQYPIGGYFKLFPDIDKDCDSIIVRIYHPNNNVRVHDTILITNSTNFEDIPARYLNGSHIVTRVSLDNNFYDILLNNVNLDPSLCMSISNVPNRAGGEEIVIYTPNIFRIRFDFQDTFGRILGFRNVGELTSITPFYPVITNDTLYQNENVRDSGITEKSFMYMDTNITESKLNLNLNLNLNTNHHHETFIHGPLEFEGPQYILMTCREIRGSKSLGQIKDYFYRINLFDKRNAHENSTHNNTLYVWNSYVKSPVFYNDPIERLSELKLDFFSPDGLYYDFNGRDHSFVLEIITYDEIPEGTLINK